MPDDIKTDQPPASGSEKPDAKQPAVTDAPKRPLREVGPESEVRGGAEAPDGSDDLG
jgi:hypothetical protein